jgi:hypothetical protein
VKKIAKIIAILKVKDRIPNLNQARSKVSPAESCVSKI